MTAKTVTQVHQERTQPVSFEVFPPKGDLAQEDAVTLASRLAPLDPAYISVTYSAGGSGNKRATCDVASLIQRDYGVTAVAHLTCQGLLREHVADVAQTLKDAGVVNVLALRGDPVPGEQGDLAHASDLIPLLAEQGLCVGAAAYPEGHVTPCPASRATLPTRPTSFRSWPSRASAWGRPPIPRDTWAASTWTRTSGTFARSRTPARSSS